MASKPLTKAQRRALRLRRRRRRQLLTALVALLVVAILALVVWLVWLRKPARDEGLAAAPTIPTVTTEPVASTPEPVEATPVPTPEATPEPTPEPSPTPEPTATVVPGSRPNVVSFYTPQGKNYSPRVRMGDTYTGPWKKGQDIGSFEVIASDEEFLDGSFFGDIFGAAWKAFPDANSCKIGYTLRYTLDDGSEIKFSMLSPSHIEHTEYIECWLYDDYHKEPHKFYSHLKPSKMKADTLITSIKLTAGSQISHVTDIWLTAYICASLEDFDEDRNYIGDTSCTIHILKK